MHENRRKLSYADTSQTPSNSTLDKADNAGDAARVMPGAARKMDRDGGRKRPASKDPHPMTKQGDATDEAEPQVDMLVSPSHATSGISARDKRESRPTTSLSIGCGRLTTEEDEDRPAIRWAGLTIDSPSAMW